MSLAGADLVRLPYDDSLTQAGVTFSCRTLRHPLARTHRLSPRRMRNTVAEIAISLAFQRWLGAQNVPFDLIQAMPFTSPDRRTLLLGGRRVVCPPTLIRASRRIQEIQANPTQLLAVEASIHSDMLNRPGLRGQDLLIFPFLLGQETRTIASLRRADTANELTHIIAIPPPKPWQEISGEPRLERLSIMNECDHPIELTLYGLLKKNLLHALSLEVPARDKVPIPAEFVALHYIHSAHLPSGTIRLLDGKAVHVWIISIRDWFNIWIYGKEIILAGWSTLAAAQRKSSFASDEVQIPTRSRAKGKEIHLPICELRPMRELIERTIQG